MYKWLFDRILGNWQTTCKMLAPALAGLFAHYGLNVDPATISEWLAVVYAIILLLAKDQVKA